ncbi:glycoside hydrolase family 32 protein [Aquibacillus saliphilus]|uniref:glycoside hydrolase family 32 protein n=1 Tax=Aquibacillus saliphilus TaxID=1909422 RepID=UPI001CEFC69D
MVQQDILLREQAINEINKHRELVAQDRFRLNYHVMPPVGLLNDPNGLVYYKGYYHLFYQWNPLATKHGIKYWGHYRSKDLVNWETLPIALAPSDWFDKNGCYSGSAVDYDGKLYLFYTGNVRNEAGNRETYQCLAVSEDGVHFEKKGPVIYLPEGYTAHFRDPKVWQEGDQWYMVIGAQTVEEEGVVALFTSSDLENWHFHGILAGSNRNGLFDFGYMWECPDLFSIEGEDILLFSPQGLEPEGIKYNNLYQSGYFVGKFDRENHTYANGPFEELDRGFDFYAPQTTIDDNQRRIMFGWLGLPDATEEHHPTRDYQWIHAMTIPRELDLVEGKIIQRPVKELEKLREEEIQQANVKISNETVQLPNVHGKSIELNLNVITNDADLFSVAFGKVAKLSFDKSKKLFSLERKTIKGDRTEIRSCKLDNLKNLRVYLDKSSIEIFLNDGEEVFTARIFDAHNDDSIHFAAEGSIAFDLTKWELKKVF